MEKTILVPFQEKQKKKKTNSACQNSQYETDAWCDSNFFGKIENKNQTQGIFFLDINTS
jgi:hypothetical protein